MIKIVKNIVISLFTFLAFLLFMEAYIRFSGIESISNFEVDSLHGKRLRKGIDLSYFNEGFYLGETNEYGYLGPSYPPAKNENTIRVALIGDSYVESFQLFDRCSMRSVIEKELNESSSKIVEIMNFGRSGFVLSDMLVYSQNFIQDFQPDLILVFLHNEDFYTTSYQALLPSLELQEGKLIVKHDFIHTSAFNDFQSTKYLRENSSLLRMLNNGFKLYQEKFHWKIILDKFYIQSKAESDSFLMQENSKKQIADINKRIIEEWSANAKVNIVLCEKPDRNILDLIQQSEIRTSEIYTSLEIANSTGINTNYWPATGKTGHWNHAGHQIIGETLAEWIVKKKLIYP